MKIRKTTSTVLNQKGRYLLRFAVLLGLFSFAWAQSSTEQNRTRRVTGLLVGQATEGARVTIVADAMLDDYEAFRRGDRFYVKIPLTEFIGMPPSFHGDGFDDVQVQKVGDSVVISFKLQPGASARVDGSSNRLEVIFFSPSRLAGTQNANASAVRTRVTRNSGRGGTSKGDSDVAGPMPPNSPSGYSSEGLEDNSSANNAITEMPIVRTGNQRDSRSTAATSTDSAVPGNSPSQTATPYISANYSSSYPPAGPASTPTIQTSTPTGSPTTWRNRLQGVRQWVAVNRLASLIGGAAVLVSLALIGFGLNRRRNRREVILNTQRAQPKYSPDVELEDILASQEPAVFTRVAPGRYVDEDAYERWDDSIIGGETVERQGGDKFTLVTPDDSSSIKDEPWELVEAMSNPHVYQGRVQEEREVFEL